MMESSLKNYFFYFATVVLIIAGIKAASEIVVILFLSIFISSIISNLINFLQSKHIPKVISYLFATGILVLFFSSFILYCKYLIERLFNQSSTI